MGRLPELVYLMLPAYCANMAAPFTKFWRGWNRPINRRRLGDHKTVVGFGFGVGAAIATAFVQSLLSRSMPLLWEPGAWLAVGLASGIGALGGDALKSYLKRRRGIKPGASWVPADQLDFVVGALLTLSIFVRLSPLDVLIVLGFSFIADIAVNQAAYRAGIRDSAW